MIKTLKFRGKIASEYLIGQWVFGDYYVRHLDENYRYIRDYIVVNGIEYKVTEDSVNLFTGIYDKNGKEIYDNDIVRYYSKSLTGETYGLVKYKNSSSYESYYIEFYKYDGEVVRGNSRFNRNLLNSTEDNSYEVIGNLLDNPELLINYTSTAIITPKIIKFKAKYHNNLDLDSWLYGNYYNMIDEHDETIHYLHSPILGRVKINPNTLCQYTGFNDTNGNEIYENDILNFKELEISGIVYWDSISGSYRIAYDTPIPKGSTLAEGIGNNKCYIVSNYFDQPF